MEAYWAARKQQKLLAFLLLCAFLFTSLFTVQPTVAWAETADDLTLENLEPGIYYVDLTLTTQRLSANCFPGALKTISHVGIQSALENTKNVAGTYTAKLLVKEDGSRQLLLTMTTQKDQYDKTSGSYVGAGKWFLKSVLQVADGFTSATDLLPNGYTDTAVYSAEPTDELTEKYGFDTIDVTTEEDEYKIVDRRFSIRADIEKNDTDTDTYNDYVYIYAVYNNGKKDTGNCSKLTFSNPTVDEKNIDISKTDLYEYGSASENLRYNQSSANGTASGMVLLQFNSLNLTGSQDNYVRYYYSLTSAEDITENSPYVDNITGQTKSHSMLLLANSAVKDLQQADTTNFYEEVVNKYETIDIKDYVDADGNGNVTVYVKAWREETGFSDPWSGTFQFNKLGVVKLDEQNQTFQLGLAKGFIPYDMTMTANRVETYDAAAIKNSLGITTASGNNLLVYDVTTADESGNSKIEPLSGGAGAADWSTVGAYLNGWTIPAGYTPGYLDIYRIYGDNQVECLNNNDNTNNYGGTFVAIQAASGMNYWDGRYVFVKKQLPDLTNASKPDFAGNPVYTVLENDSVYSIPVELTDADDYSIIAAEDAYLDNRDKMAKSVATVQVDEDGNKTAYISLQPVNGQYINKVKYFENNRQVNADVVETYTVDGVSYPKLVAIPISDAAYQSLYIGSNFVDLSIYWAEAEKATVGLQAAAPEITTTTGATNFVNDATATVELHTATVGGTIYYTTDGTDVTTGSGLVYEQPINLKTTNQGGETVTVKAMTVKEGMADSAVSSLNIVFKKQGEAAETVATPQVRARYDYSDDNNGKTAETGMYLLEIVCDTEDANIYYTTDGSTPTVESQAYTGKVQVPAMTNGAATTIKAIAVKEGLNDSAIGSQTIQFSTAWWDNMCEGDEYEVGIAMKNYSYWNSTGRYQESMGALGLTGVAYVYVQDGKTYLRMPFQGMNMGQLGICYMTHLWYFEDNSQSAVNAFPGNIGTNTAHEAEYDSLLDGHRVNSNVTIELYNSDEHVFAGIESEVDIMGRQRALLLMDYSNIEKAITGGSSAVEENKAATPTISYEYDKDNDSNTITIAADGADEIYYAIVSDDETVDYAWVKYDGAFTVTNDNPNVITDGVTTKVNIVAYATQSRKDSSDITMQMVTFAAKADDSIKTGTYKVPVRAQNAYTSEASMANNALDGPALVTVDENGNATMELTFKGVTIGEQYGHLLTLGVYPIGTDVNNIADWNKTTIAKILSYKEDTGLSGNVQEFGRVWQLTDRVAGEDTIYIRVDVDAMNGFPQDARLIFDWSNAVLVDGEEEPDTVDKSELNSQISAAKGQLDEGVYTDASVTALNSVLAIAEQVVNDESATQEEVNKQITAVKAATTALLPKEQKAEVNVTEEKTADVPVAMTDDDGNVYNWTNVMEDIASMTVKPDNNGTGTLTITFADAGSTTAGCITWMGNADGTSPSSIQFYPSGALQSVSLENVKIGQKIIDITIQFKTAVEEAVALLVDDDTEKIPAKLNMSSWETFYTSVLGETNAYSKVEETQAVLLAQVAAAQAKTKPTAISNEQWAAFQAVIAAAEEAATTEIIQTTQVNNSLNALQAALELVKVDVDDTPVVEDELYTPKISVSATEANKGENVTVEITYPGLLEGVELYYTLDGTIPNPNNNPSTMLYTAPFTVTGDGGRNITITARAFYDGMNPSSVDTQMVKFTLSTTGGGSNIADEEESDWYSVEVYLWKASGDEASMGDVAFENNRQAWVKKNSNGTYTIYVGTNPVSVSGYTSALQDIQGRGFTINVEKTESFTTNTKHDGVEHTFNYVSEFSFNVNNLEDIYAPVKISVPYTPMDGITMNVGGYIDARLRFDWSSLTAIDGPLESNNASAKGATDLLSESVDITDDATGVRLVADEDVLPEGTALTVDAITSGSSFDTATKALDGIAEQFKLYNIQVKADGEDVEPSTTVKLYLPIPSDYDSSKAAVYRINSDGTKVVVKGTVEDGKYVIETKTFGLYAVALTDTVQQVVVNTTYDEAVAKVAEKYPDINNHWAASSIAFVVNRGLMGGVADGQFGPNLQLTRGMLVTILGRLEGFDASKYTTSSFSDVSADAWYAPSVQWAAEMGIVSGVGDGKFAPDQAITREQLAAILANYAAKKNIELKDGPSVKFADSNKISPWAASAMDAMVKAGIIRGNADGTLNPQGTATRAEVATMLQRFIVNYVDAPVEQD